MRGAVWGSVALATFAVAGALGARSDSGTVQATPGFFAPGPSRPRAAAPLPSLQQRPRTRFHEFYFTRAIYSDWGGGGGFGFGGSWAIDYPDADYHFVTVARRLANVDAFDGPQGNAVSLADPELRRFPFLYALEVGRMSLSEREITGLRSYLAAGGFLVIDDFWGTQEWANFEREIRRVLPDNPIVELPITHSLFNIYYNIDEVLQVPGVRNGYNVSQGFGVTYEKDGYVPHVRGIFGDDGRLLVVINWNTDLGDAWEHADDPFYPLKYSTYAFEVAMNLIIYGMSH